MITPNYQELTHEVLQPHPLKRISSRDSERRTLKGRETDQASKAVGSSQTREDRG